ncbi:MAG: hypothetical protein HY744_10635 [Deltaproteobacteria bacterium]|nr:hypothetical protein [Deltaproteobacteria bacterium]
MTATAASYSAATATRYVTLFRTGDPPQVCGLPYELRYFIVDGNASGVSFGELAVWPTITQCGGIDNSCKGLDPDGTTWQPSAATDDRWAVFGYHRSPVNGGFMEINALRFAPAGTHANDLVKDSAYPTGAPACLTLAVAVASSERRDGNDKILVAYMRGTTTVDAWVLAATLYVPGSAPVDLQDTVPCDGATCARGATSLDVEAAYNALEDKFLAVSVLSQFSPNPRVVGRIFDAQTGALGPRVDFGGPAAGEHNQVGVASIPLSTANPEHEWVVFVGTRRYHVRPDGTFSSGTIDPPPNPVAGQWTLNWTDAPSDAYDYERLLDAPAAGQAVSSARYPAGFSPAGEIFPLDWPTIIGYPEDLAHDYTSNHSIANWSVWTCPSPTYCDAGFRWRVIDQ